MLNFLRCEMNGGYLNLPRFLFMVLFCGTLFSTQSSAQQLDIVDFLKAEAKIFPDVLTKTIKGDIKYTFQILKSTDSVYLDAKNMTVSNLNENGISIKAEKDKIWLIDKFLGGKEYTVSFSYEVIPQQTFYFIPDGEMWTQGQGKYTSHWLPSIDDTNDKIEFDLTIKASNEHTVIANGRLIQVENQGEVRIWEFDMNAPMSSYLVAIAIGNFNKEELISESGIPLENYFKPKDSLKVEPTYRYSKQIFDFLEDEIGVPYPWQNYKQVPVRDFLYAGMENTTATFFSEAFMVDSIGFNDRNYINVNAHELAHQWFGNLVTAETDADHWLQEGFATYYALLAERDVFGEGYFYWQLLQTSEQLKAASDEGKGESLLNPKASSLTFYQKGAWALHILKELIGETDFKLAVINYLEKYKFQNVSSDDFLNEVKAVSKVDISTFERNWLHQSAFKAEEAYLSLKKSPFINRYFEIAALRATPLTDKKNQLKSALTFPDDFIGQEAVYQLMGEPISEALSLYKTALENNNLYVRQAVVVSLENVPAALLKEYESLLNDESFVTMEAAMYQIYMQFPQRRIDVLERTKNSVGFQNKNIRQLWLALALITESYEPTKKEEYLNELRHYSSEEYSFEIREKAFEYINELNLWDMATLENLVEAAVHPNWRFAKSSRALLNSLTKNPEKHRTLVSLKPKVSKKASDYLNSITK